MTHTVESTSGADPLRALLQFHRHIRAALDTFDDVAREARDGRCDPVKAAALVDFFTGPMRWHDIDERDSLLPRLSQAEPASFRDAVSASIAEHAAVERVVDAVLEHLQELAAQVAHPDPESLARAADELRAVLAPHLEREETTVFPRARALLDHDALLAMAREIAARRSHRISLKDHVPLGGNP